MDVCMKNTEQHLDGGLNHRGNFDDDIHLISLRDGHFKSIMITRFRIK